jgi:hypothetical protein
MNAVTKTVATPPKHIAMTKPQRFWIGRVGISKSTGGDVSKFKISVNVPFFEQKRLQRQKRFRFRRHRRLCSRILHRCNYDLNDYDIYHYCPKVSNKERNEGCGDLEKKAKTEKYVGGETKCSVCGKFFLSTKNLCECSEMEFGAKSTRILNPTTNNHHPTVKPIALLKKIIATIQNTKSVTRIRPFHGQRQHGYCLY